MKFKEWHNKVYNGHYNSDFYFSGQAAWEGCKNEILALLSHKDCYIDKEYVAVPNHIIEEIKKL